MKKQNSYYNPGERPQTPATQGLRSGTLPAARQVVNTRQARRTAERETNGGRGPAERQAQAQAEARLAGGGTAE